VACLKEDPDVILGYSVTDGTRIHWVHLKAAWRGIGLARSLIPKNADSASHMTKIGLAITKKYPQIKFRPFSL
jgi:hypothetical protein